MGLLGLERVCYLFVCAKRDLFVSKETFEDDLKESVIYSYVLFTVCVQRLKECGVLQPLKECV